MTESKSDPHETSILMLMDFGFDRAAVITALEANDWDLAAAGGDLQAFAAATSDSLVASSEGGSSLLQMNPFHVLGADDPWEDVIQLPPNITLTNPSKMEGAGGEEKVNDREGILLDHYICFQKSAIHDLMFGDIVRVHYDPEPGYRLNISGDTFYIRLSPTNCIQTFSRRLNKDVFCIDRNLIVSKIPSSPPVVASLAEDGFLKFRPSPHGETTVLFNWSSKIGSGVGARASCHLNKKGVLKLTVKTPRQSWRDLFYVSGSGNVYMSLELLKEGHLQINLESLGIYPQQIVYRPQNLQRDMHVLFEKTREADEILESALNPNNDGGETKNNAIRLRISTVETIDELRSILNSSLQKIQARAEEVRLFDVSPNLINNFVVTATKYVRIQIKYRAQQLITHSTRPALLRGRSDGVPSGPGRPEIQRSKSSD